MKLKTAVYSLWKTLSQNYDDADISKTQILYWLLFHADKLKKAHIKNENLDTGAFLHIYSDIPVISPVQSFNPDIVEGRKKIDIPANIYDFDDDRGIDYISYNKEVDGCHPPFTSVTFTRTTPSKSKILYFTEEEKPTPDNPYFYRIGNYIYLLGIECIDVLKVELGLFTSFNINDYFSASCNLEQEFDFPSELMPVLEREVLNMGRFALIVPREIINDASEVMGGMQNTKVFDETKKANE